jgi:glutamate N-acetyltransferase / amino-acid N-acetyltransferase
VTGAGVTAATGFRAAGVSGGLKSNGALDVAVVVNDGPCHSAAGVFTRNRVQAAPVAWSREVVAGGDVRAVVLNSGGANACTGRAGWDDTVDTASALGRRLGVPTETVAVCSTGLIGERLDMTALRRGADRCAADLRADGGADAARAIMTTDSVPKTAQIDGPGFVVGGMAKGAGMLAPGLATMLAVLTTDADVPAHQLDAALRAVTARTFDRVDSDGCMSTNDTVLLLASGASGVAPPSRELEHALESVCRGLSRQLVADAEGATKDITVEVVGAVDEDDAVEVARAVARSNLFKCAVHGEDPNWGRVLSAVGTSSAVFRPEQLAVAINGVWVARDGGPGEDRAKVEMTAREVVVTVDLGAGSATGWVWTNDLTAQYVHENSAYSS